ncbi:flippase [Halalkalicoccus salilacus]
MAVGSLLTVILARLLNPTGYGLLFLAITIFNIASIFSRFGVAKSSARYIAEYKEKNSDQIPHIIHYSLSLNILTSLIIGGIFLVGDTSIATLLDEPKLADLLLLGPPFIILYTLMDYSRTIFQGFEDIHSAALIRILERVIKFGAIVILVAFGYGATGAIVGYIIGYFCSSAFGLGYLYYTYYRKYSRSTTMEKGLQRRIAEYSFPVTLTNSADKVEKQMDVLIVGFLLDPAAVGFYVLGKQLMQFISVPVSALGFVISPTLGNKKANDDLSGGSSIYRISLSNSLLIYVPAAAGLFLLAEPGVLIVFGDEYLGAVPILQVFSVYIILRSITHISSNGLDYLGRAKTRAITKSITAVLNMLLTVILVIEFGVIGAAIATVLTFSLYTFVVIYVVKSEFGLDIMDLLKEVSKMIPATLLMSIIVYYMAGMIDGIYSLLSVIVFGIVIYLLASIGTGALKLDNLTQIIKSLITS